MESELFRMSQNVETHLPSIGGACCNKLHTKLAGDRSETMKLDVFL